MEIDQLKLFTEVIRLGSFTAVARQRRIAPSSVSRSIAALEADLGARLFQRSTRKLNPTDQGLVFYRRIETLIEETHPLAGIEQALARAHEVFKVAVSPG